MPINPHFAATIGFFDGVHRGHQFLIDCLKDEARRRGLHSMVITFAHHPRQVVDPGWKPLLLSTPAEKEQLLRQTGIDRLVVLPFDRQTSQLSAQEFMQQVLCRELHVGLLLTGYDNHFGHRTPGLSEGFSDYAAYGRKLGMEVMAARPYSPDGQCFSSSLVRSLVARGQMEEAARSLGRHYSLCGTVVHGHEVGRLLGYPTANIAVDNPLKLIPAQGVYAVTVGRQDSQGKDMAATPLPGMMNIGHRPTFDGQATTLEVHLFGFSGNLYGSSLSISLVSRLRDEQHFPSPQALARQMEADAVKAQTILSNL